MRRITALLVGPLVLLMVSAGAVFAQQAPVIEVDSPIRGFEIDPNRERVDLDLVVYNRADERRTVQFVLEDVPEGWNIGVWSRFFDFRITEFVVESTAANPNRLQQARIRIVPPPAAQRQGGDYAFTMVVLSQDGTLEYDRITYRMRLFEPEGAAGGAVTVRTGIPSIQAAPGTTLGYEIIVRNDTGEETSFGLSAQAPEGWQVTFRQPFGDRRVIGGVTVRSGFTERVRVDIRPPRGIPLGEYEIPVRAASDRGEATIVLRANLVGQGTLRMAAATGSPVVRTTPGSSGTLTMRLTNAGTDVLRNIPLQASAPEGWTVDFNVPDHIVDDLPADYQIDIDVTITPPRGTSAGDYIVRVEGGDGPAATTMDARVIVNPSPIGEWLSVAAVVLATSALIGLILNPKLVVGRFRR